MPGVTAGHDHDLVSCEPLAMTWTDDGKLHRRHTGYYTGGTMAVTITTNGVFGAVYPIPKTATNGLPIRKGMRVRAHIAGYLAFADCIISTMSGGQWPVSINRSKACGVPCL